MYKFRYQIKNSITNVVVEDTCSIIIAEKILEILNNHEEQYGRPKIYKIFDSLELKYCENVDGKPQNSL
jgi:hypothetical protein